MKNFQTTVSATPWQDYVQMLWWVKLCMHYLNMVKTEDAGLFEAISNVDNNMGDDKDVRPAFKSWGKCVLVGQEQETRV